MSNSTADGGRWGAKSPFLAVPLPAHTPCPVPPPHVTMKWGCEGRLGRGKDVTNGASWCAVYVRKRKLGLSPTGCCDHRRWTERFSWMASEASLFQTFARQSPMSFLPICCLPESSPKSASTRHCEAFPGPRQTVARGPPSLLSFGSSWSQYEGSSCPVIFPHVVVGLSLGIYTTANRPWLPFMGPAGGGLSTAAPEALP